MYVCETNISNLIWQGVVNVDMITIQRSLCLRQKHKDLYAK